MARLVFEIVSHLGVRHNLIVIEKDCVTIGRGFSSDIILHDPFVSASHAVVRLTPEGTITVEDTGTPNGVFLLPKGGKPFLLDQPNTPAPIDSGTDFVVGKTTIRVFHPSHTVTPARLLGRREKPGPVVRRPTETWYALAAFFILTVTDFMAHYAYTDPSWNYAVFSIFSLLFLMSLWSGIWALAGRMLRRGVKFREHFTLVCVYTVVMIPAMNIAGYLGFIFAEPAAEIAAALIAGLAAFIWLLFWHLTYATHLKFKPRLVSASAIPSLLFLLGLSGGLAYENMFSSDPPSYARLKPPFIRPVRVISVDEFIDRNTKMFTEARKKMEAKRSAPKNKTAERVPPDNNI